MNEDALFRYSVIDKKNPREIILLRGSRCKWLKCKFCDYHLDYSLDENANFELNKKIISHVTGRFKKLEVVNSGSFCDLDSNTVSLIKKTCLEKNITQLHFESHWMYRDLIKNFKKQFENIGITVKMKIGIETFDYEFRENFLKKGITTNRPEEIAKYFDEACFLFGLTGQNINSMKNDIETGLKHFQRICINIMTENSTRIKPDNHVIQTFIENIYPIYQNDSRVDILIHNTDFGVGGVK